MWDFFVGAKGEVLRLGMHPTGEIIPPVARLRLGSSFDRFAWLSEGQTLAAFGESETFLMPPDLSEMRQLPPIGFVAPRGDMGFTYQGHKTAKNIVIVPLTGGQPIVISNISALPDAYTFLPTMDAVVLGVADDDTGGGRNLIVVPLAQIREWIEQGVTRAELSDLDYDPINGLRHDIAQNVPLNLAPLPDYNGWITFWNTKPGAGGTTEGQFIEFEYPYWDSGSSARSQVRLESKVQSFPRFFTRNFVSRRTKKAGIVLYAVGTTRKGPEFTLGVQALSLLDPDPNVRMGLANKEFTEIKSKKVRVHHAGALTEVQALPGAAGFLVRAENPDRIEQLFHVDVGPGQLAETFLEFDPLPDATCLVGEDIVERDALGGGVRPALPPAFEGPSSGKMSLFAAPPEAEAAPEAAAPAAEEIATPQAPEATDATDVSDVIDVDFDVDIDASAEAIAEPSAAPAVARVSLWSGALPVVPGVGIDIPVGMAPADADLHVTAAATDGDPKTCNLRWWLSQSATAGDALYTLHLRADTQVTVRVSVKVG